TGCVPNDVRLPVVPATRNTVRLRLVPLAATRTVPSPVSARASVSVPPVANGEPVTAVTVVAAPLPAIWYADLVADLVRHQVEAGRVQAPPCALRQAGREGVARHAAEDPTGAGEHADLTRAYVHTEEPARTVGRVADRVIGPRVERRSG